MLNALHKILPESQIQQSENVDHPLGNSPPYIVYPQTEAEVAAILKVAFEQSLTVIPVGGGTKRGFGGTEQEADLLLSLSELKGIIDHSVGDMTLTVLPGTTIEEINNSLAAKQQMVALDPSFPKEATIGGVIAANDSGPKRIRYGSARDHVIGLRIAFPDGSVSRTGGKVVKNVAGYDMNKLFVGSMGTLGILTEVTLKLRPLPKYTGLVQLTFPESELNSLHAFIVDLLDTQLEPVSLEVLSPAMNQRLNATQGYGLMLTFEDVSTAVQVQMDWVLDHVSNAVLNKRLIQEDAQLWWRMFADIASQEYDSKPSELELSLKIGTKNIDVLHIVQHAHLLGEEWNVDVQAHGGAGHGISKIYVQGESENILKYVQQIRTIAEDLGGYCLITHAPLAVRQSLPVWGEKPAYFPLLEGIKNKIDPRFVLNAKRFVGGI